MTSIESRVEVLENMVVEIIRNNDIIKSKNNKIFNRFAEQDFKGKKSLNLLYKILYKCKILNEMHTIN